MPDVARGGPFHNPFAALGALRDELPAGDPASLRSPATARPPAPRRAVVHLERKGRGGKEVTRLELRGLPDEELPARLTELRRALGCGGAIEGGAIVLQGDQRERLRSWLADRGPLFADESG